MHKHLYFDERVRYIETESLFILRKMIFVKCVYADSNYESMFYKKRLKKIAIFQEWASIAQTEYCYFLIFLSFKYYISL